VVGGSQLGAIADGVNVDRLAVDRLDALVAIVEAAEVSRDRRGLVEGDVGGLGIGIV